MIITCSCAYKMLGLGLLIVLAASPTAVSAGHDYRDALSKCIMFFEGQRSGKIPPNQHIKWRRDSGLRDGSTQM